MQLEMRNVSDRPVTLKPGPRGDYRFRLVIFDAEGGAAYPNNMAAPLLPLGVGAGTLWDDAHSSPALTLLPQQSVPLPHSSFRLAVYCAGLPAGTYTALVLATTRADGLPALLMSNLLPFQWAGRPR